MSKPLSLKLSPGNRILPVVLTIAGSDSSGGAGIQADLKTFQSLACFGTSAITALTAQNTCEVKSIYASSPEFLADQIQAVLDDFDIAAIKTGMLASSPLIEAVQNSLQTWLKQKRPLVVDPVMVAASGAVLLESKAQDALWYFIRECASLVTPNIPEAEILFQKIKHTRPEDVSILNTAREAKIHKIKELEYLAQALCQASKTLVLLKGGHRLLAKRLSGLGVTSTQVESAEHAIDIYSQAMKHKANAKPSSQLAENNTKTATQILRYPWLKSSNTHGTGCTLSAAITAYLAQGYGYEDAIQKARHYLQGALSFAPNLGAGSGPLNHSWNLTWESSGNWESI